jgi:hypothetical protein
MIGLFWFIYYNFSFNFYFLIGQSTSFIQRKISFLEAHHSFIFHSISIDKRNDLWLFILTNSYNWSTLSIFFPIDEWILYVLLTLAMNGVTYSLPWRPRLPFIWMTIDIQTKLKLFEYLLLIRLLIFFLGDQVFVVRK